MDSSPETKFGILLVAKEATFSTTLFPLIEAGFRVTIAYKGGDALSILQKKKRKVDLVLTETKLPDVCAFMFVQILQTEFRLPVVNVTPLALLRHINAPGLTMEIITEKLEKYYLYLHKQQDLALNNPFRLLEQVINSEYDFPQPDEESPYFRFLRESGIYADRFPWAMEMLTSAEALLDGLVPLSFLWEAPPRLPSAKAVHSLVPPSYFFALPPMLPVILPPLFPRPRGEGGARENGD